MVRHILQGRLTRLLRRLGGPLWPLLAALRRYFTLWLRWLLAWLAHLQRETGLRAQVGVRLVRMSFRPADPNNLFVEPGAFEMAERGRQVSLAISEGTETGKRQSNLVMVGEGRRAHPEVLAQRTTRVIATVNRQAAHTDLLATELRRMQLPQIQELTALITLLARRWLDLDQDFAPVERRNRLDVRRTLKENLSRYGGHVLQFRWATHQRPIPKLHKPARILVIGDVSHSMYHYVSVVLYFFHLLNFRFQVESYVFSQHATRSSPYLNGPGTFTEKVQELTQNARSWNAGTRFGTSLEEILAEARIDPYTYVIIATDGKFTLSHGELERIQQNMKILRQRSRMIIFLTPEAGLAERHGQPSGDIVVGSFQSGIIEIPILDLNQIWYQTLGQYADRVYHVRTVQDLVNTVEDLAESAVAV